MFTCNCLKYVTISYFSFKITCSKILLSNNFNIILSFGLAVYILLTLEISV